MAADLSGCEKMALTTPETAFKLYVVLVMVAVECRGKTRDVYSVFLFCVQLGLLYLADNAGVHLHLVVDRQWTRLT